MQSLINNKMAHRLHMKAALARLKKAKELIDGFITSITNSTICYLKSYFFYLYLSYKRHLILILQ